MQILHLKDRQSYKITDLVIKKKNFNFFKKKIPNFTDNEKELENKTGIKLEVVVSRDDNFVEYGLNINKFNKINIFKRKC